MLARLRHEVRLEIAKSVDGLAHVNCRHHCRRRSLCGEPSSYASDCVGDEQAVAGAGMMEMCRDVVASRVTLACEHTSMKERAPRVCAFSAKAMVT